MKRDADRRDYVYRDQYGRLVNVKHFEVMACFGPAEYFGVRRVRAWWRDGDRELTARELQVRAIARIVYDTLTQRATQTQLEIGL